MISCDSIIENGSLYLRNLNTRATSKDVWVTGDTSVYPVAAYYYDAPLQHEHIYFLMGVYKFTTTNQSPTWAKMYLQEGAVGSTAQVQNPVAGTEYQLYGIGTADVFYRSNYGTLYNGNSNAINGVTGYLKNCAVYDVTYLYIILRNYGVISNKEELGEWCKENLEFKLYGELYDLTSLFENLTKTTMLLGNICCEAVECDGMEYYSASYLLRQNPYFDKTTLGFYTYNNMQNGTVTFNKIDAKTQNSPFYPKHPYIIEVKTNGEAYPGTGGFLAQHTAAANKIFIEKFVAKVPVGYNVSSAYNSQGDGASVTYLTPRAGTGDWEEYAILYKCGTGGTFSTGGHVYLEPQSGYSATAVTWYLAYVNNCDITSDESLKNYTVLPNKDVIKGNKVFSSEFNTGNFISNGECTDSGMTLPSGWTYDDTDYAGNAKRSIVQPVGTNAALNVTNLFGHIKIDANTKYKLSYWVKCKRDMTAFLTAILPYAEDGVLLSHKNVVYINGTNTMLSDTLKAGDTQMSVNSNANWVAREFSNVGFRQWADTYNRFGTFENGSTGVVKGVSGSTIVLFNTPYTGETRLRGTYVVESFDGGNYPYPVGIDKLPTDNTWKYVEGYFGGDVFWDGAATTEGGWKGLPGHTNDIQIALNLYNNNGTVPIKYCDIRLEQVGSYGDGERKENKIQFKKHN